MDVNIYDYFDRWWITYIVYHKEHLREYGDVANAAGMFNARYQQEVGKLRSSAQQNQIAALQNNLRAQAPSASAGPRILNDLQNGALLSQIMDGIAESINQQLDASGGSVDLTNYDQIQMQAKEFSSMLAGSPRVGQVNDFFNLLISAMNQAQMINPAVLDALSGIGQQLIGTQFAIDQKWRTAAELVDQKDIVQAQKVIESLSKAAQKMQLEGSVSSRSFAGTIRNIFSEIIGKQVAQLILANTLSEGMEQVESVIDEAIRDSKGVLKRDYTKNKKYTNTLNIKIFDKDIMSLKMKGVAHNTYNIEIANSSDIRWSTKKGTAISLVREEGLKNYFVDREERYLAYNMIAHRGLGADFDQAIQNIQASVSASFFNEWINQGMTAKANMQFIIVNGRIWSLSRIIANICDDLVKRSSASPIKIDIPKDRNKWVGKGPNWENALKRSDIVNNLIDELLISARLNSNVLAKYAY